MINKIHIILIFFLIVAGIIISCSKKEWDEYYNDYDEQVDMNIWDAVKEEPRYASFVEYMEEYELDSLFESGLSFTLFIPDNEAMEVISDTAGSIDKILSNHISRTVFLTRNLELSRKLETLSGKFAIVSRTIDGFAFEGQTIEYSSPLYQNGKMYEISEIAYPKPNLYEFTRLFSSVISDYIDLNDSAYLDKSLSDPVGFDDQGNTIYDSVVSVINLFERDFFPVSQEFRDKSATFILFTQGQYDDALDEMAGLLGSGFSNHEDIPEKWQFEVLLPDIMAKSLFDNQLEYNQLQIDMVSATGDSVVIDPANINPDSRYLCSNGIVYTYYDFTVEKDLYQGILKVEGEELLDSIGAGVFAWKEDVISSGLIVAPDKQYVAIASDGILVSVQFPRNYSGEYSLEFNIRNVFPMKYRLEWRASYRPSGIFSISVNETDLGSFDTYNLRSSVISVTGERFIPEEGFNSKDWWVENISDFGDVTIRIDYLDSGIGSNNGLNIDYIALIPVSEE